MNDIEERLTRTFNTVAEQTSTESDWNRVVRDAESAAVASAPLRLRVLAIAAMLAIVVGAGAFVLDNQDSSNQVDATQLSPFVLPGEEVLSLDPLTVIPAPAPEPRFDTSDLGTEIVVQPLEALDDAAQASLDLQLSDEPERTITKVTLLFTVDGRSAVQLITDGPDSLDPEVRNLRMKFFQSEGGGFGSGDWVDADGMDLIDNTSALSDGFSYSTPMGDVVWEVPDNAAVVTFESDDTQIWTRPVGGYAVFTTELHDGERVTLQALDATGRLIDQNSETIRY